MAATKGYAPALFEGFDLRENRRLTDESSFLDFMRAPEPYNSGPGGRWLNHLPFFYAIVMP